MNVDSTRALRDLDFNSLIERLAHRIAGSLADAGVLRRSTAGNGSAAAFADYIASAAARYDVPEELVKAVIQTESNFNAEAVSPAGAKGLMQLMDGTARAMGCQDSFDPVQNIEAGVRYLRDQIDRFGNLPMALAAYNAGPGAVERYGGIPPYAETQAYVRRVLNRYDHDWEA